METTSANLGGCELQPLLFLSGTLGCAAGSGDSSPAGDKRRRTLRSTLPGASLNNGDFCGILIGGRLRYSATPATSRREFPCRPERRTPGDRTIAQLPSLNAGAGGRSVFERLDRSSPPFPPRAKARPAARAAGGARLTLGGRPCLFPTPAVARTPTLRFPLWPNGCAAWRRSSPTGERHSRTISVPKIWPSCSPKSVDCAVHD